MVDPSVANADEYIDFGTNQAACKSAAQQANATGNRYSYRYQTGPGRYKPVLRGLTRTTSVTGGIPLRTADGSVPLVVVPDL